MKKKTTLLLFLLILSIYASNINVQITAEENNYRPTSLELTPHDSISITSDSDFEIFPGTGIAEDPYLIEGYDITTTSSRGIYITGTTKYFVIRNCYVDAGDYGIYIVRVSDGTATIINNTCNKNVYGIWLVESSSSTVINNTCSNNICGIALSSSGSSTVINNTCNSNDDMSIALSSSGSSTVANNTCNNNNELSIALFSSGSSTIANNTCSNNDFGISLIDSGNSTVANNTCSNNYKFSIYLESSGSSTVANNTCSNNIKYNGIRLDYSDYSTVANNTCSNNNRGIYIFSSSFCVVTYNLLQENEGYGVYTSSGSANNTIHHNNFVDNNPLGASQALDDGTTNIWYDTNTNEGNYWSDWSEIGSYSIDGSASSIDLYPFDEPTVFLGPPVIIGIINSPSSPTELDTISINATVTSPYGVHSVTFHYKVNGGAWIEVNMTLINSDLYSVTIGPFAVGDTIEYYVSAADNSVNPNLAINDNSGLYYSFTVSEVIPEFQTLSILLPTLTFLFLVFGLVVLQRRKK